MNTPLKIKKSEHTDAMIHKRTKDKCTGKRGKLETPKTRMESAFHGLSCICILLNACADHQILRKEVLNCHVLPQLHTHMASYLASTLFNTSYLKLNISEQLSLQNEFSGNSAMIAITSDVISASLCCFLADLRNRWYLRNPLYMDIKIIIGPLRN